MIEFYIYKYKAVSRTYDFRSWFNLAFFKSNNSENVNSSILSRFLAWIERWIGIIGEVKFLAKCLGDFCGIWRSEGVIGLVMSPAYILSCIV